MDRSDYRIPPAPFFNSVGGIITTNMHSELKLICILHAEAKDIHTKSAVFINQCTKMRKKQN